MESESALNNATDVDTQEARAFLRERFLRFIAKISTGQRSEMILHEHVTVKGKLRGFDSNFENIVVEDLQTPYLPVEKAILRASDIISIHLSDVAIESLLH